MRQFAGGEELKAVIGNECNEEHKNIACSHTERAFSAVHSTRCSITRRMVCEGWRRSRRNLCEGGLSV
jgi:hypothetical protein